MVPAAGTTRWPWHVAPCDRDAADGVYDRAVNMATASRLQALHSHLLLGCPAAGYRSIIDDLLSLRCAGAGCAAGQRASGRAGQRAGAKCSPGWPVFLCLHALPPGCRARMSYGGSCRS